MNFKRAKLFSPVMATAFFLFFLGCEESVKIANNRPSIDLFTKNVCYVERGGTVKFRVGASDADGDRLFYSWSATGGTFSEISDDKTEATWVAPDEPGRYEVTVKVTDEIEDNFSTLSIDVCEFFPSVLLGDTTISYHGYKYILKKFNTLRVEKGITLTIGPGVTVIFDSEYSGIDVYGSLVVQGESGSEVSFIPNYCGTEGGYWRGIYFSGQDATGDLRYALVSASSDGIKVEGGASVTLTNCTVYNNTEFGIYIADMSEVSIQNCKVWENGDGIYIRNSDVEIVGSSVRYNKENGVDISASSEDFQISVSECRIANNIHNGILVNYGARPTIHNCSIFYNGVDLEDCYAIKLSAFTETDSIHAENNFWGQGKDTEAEISELIYDANDDPGVGGYVSFIPFLTSPPSLFSPDNISDLLTPKRGEKFWER